MRTSAGKTWALSDLGWGGRRRRRACSSLGPESFRRHTQPARHSGAFGMRLQHHQARSRPVGRTASALRKRIKVSRTSLSSINYVSGDQEVVMNTIYFDSTVDDETRRKQLYQGQLFVYSPSPSSSALCSFAREMIQEAFGSVDPLKAQYSM